MVVEPPEGTGLSAKTYTVRISRALTAAELEADRDALRLGGGDSTVEVSADLDLPETGASGLSSITWTSSAPDVISGSGVVRRGAKEQTVTLTATLSAAGLESLTKIFTVTVTPVGAREVLDNIAARYAASGAAGDGNGPWLAADLAAYAAAWPDRGHKLSADQVQACLDTFLAKADATDAPGDLAKYIIALRALGYDARKTVTADLREVDVVAKLTALVDGKAASVTNPYTLPYVILALQQGEGYATQAQMDYLIQAAVDSQDSWGNTSWGPDGATPMLLALAPYCDGNALVKDCLLYTSRGTWAQTVVMAATIVTIVYGSARALRTPHLKRRLAFSTVSNLSYILFAFTIMTPAGLLGGLTHMVYHAVVKITMFCCAGAILHKSGREYVYDLENFGRVMPVVFAAFTVSSFALIGLPPLGGFAGKWMIATAAVALSLIHICREPW